MKGGGGKEKKYWRKEFLINREHTLESMKLPGSYGETTLFLMAVEPYRLHVIWEVDTETQKGMQEQFADQRESVKFMLRFYDVTRIEFGSENYQASFDKEINLNDKKCYVSLQEGGKAYVAEIGYKKRSGPFCSLVRSNVTETPRAGITPVKEDRFLPVAESPESADILINDSGGPLSAEQLISEKKFTPAPCWTSEDTPEKELFNNPQSDFSIFAIDVLRQEHLAHRPITESESSLLPRILATQVVQKPSQQVSGFDLTETSESRFIAGISSRLDN